MASGRFVEPKLGTIKYERIIFEYLVALICTSPIQMLNKRVLVVQIEQFVLDTNAGKQLY
jgi:hypothetical protein